MRGGPVAFPSSEAYLELVQKSHVLQVRASKTVLMANAWEYARVCVSCCLALLPYTVMIRKVIWKRKPQISSHRYLLPKSLTFVNRQLNCKSWWDHSLLGIPGSAFSFRKLMKISTNDWTRQYKVGSLWQLRLRTWGKMERQDSKQSSGREKARACHYKWKKLRDKCLLQSRVAQREGTQGDSSFWVILHWNNWEKNSTLTWPYPQLCLLHLLAFF